MAKGFLVLEKVPKVLEEIANEIDNFDIKSGSCMFFDPKKLVYKKIEKQGRKLGAHIAVIDNTFRSSIICVRGTLTYEARGRFYRID